MQHVHYILNPQLTYIIQPCSQKSRKKKREDRGERARSERKSYQLREIWFWQIDQCNRLWVLDTGIAEHTTAKACQAQLLAFDLTRDKLAKRIKIPNHIAQNDQGMTRLVKPIVETKGQQCDHTTVRHRARAYIYIHTYSLCMFHRLEH